MTQSDPSSYAQLTDSTFLRFVDHHRELASSNDFANRLAADQNLETPALVICDRQTAGRGRGSNRWWSSVDNLACSLIIDLPAAISPERSMLLSPLTALAICEGLAAYHAADPFQIKWPNDVFTCGRKISGILIESSSRIHRRRAIGCGINVNLPTAAAVHQARDAAELVQQSISLIDLTGQSIDRAGLLRRFIDCFEQKLELLATEQVTTLVEQIRSHCFLTGKKVTIAQMGKRISGECLGIDAQGGMQVRTPTGTETLFSGVVESFSSD